MTPEERHARDQEFERELQDAAQRIHAWSALKKQPDRLRQFAADWREARALHTFLDALEERLSLSDSATTPLLEWLKWAHAHADALDPLSVQGLVRIRGNAEVVAGLECEGSEPTEDEWELYHNGFLDDHLEELEGQE